MQSLRSTTPLTLIDSQVVALSRVAYDAWSQDPKLSYKTTVVLERGKDGLWKRVAPTVDGLGADLSTTERRLTETLEGNDSESAEAIVGPLVDRALMQRGITSVDANSRGALLREFLRALSQGMTGQARKATDADYSPDANASRFPAWQGVDTTDQRARVTLTGLVEDWWREAERTGRSQSVYKTYRRVLANLSRFLGRDDATRVTEPDIVSFKDWRLGQTSPTTGKPISARTTTDSDLSAPRGVFQWATSDKCVTTLL